MLLSAKSYLDYHSDIAYYMYFFLIICLFFGFIVNRRIHSALPHIFEDQCQNIAKILFNKYMLLNIGKTVK